MLLITLGCLAWLGAPLQVIQTDAHNLTLTHSGRTQKFSFELEIYRFQAHPELPLAWVTTVDWESCEVFDTMETPQWYWQCKAFLLNIALGTAIAVEGGCTALAHAMWSPGGRYAFINGAIYEAADLVAGNDFNKLNPVAKIWGREESCGSNPHLDSYEWLNGEHLSSSGGDCGCIYNLVVDVHADTAYWFHIQFEESHCPKDYGTPEDYKELVRFLTRGNTTAQR